jgi:exodeoxyribonuclease VII large subunit
VISGVGHEIDFTIADFCADLRAPTPSAAAEIAVPDVAEIEGLILALRASVEESWQRRVAQCRSAWDIQRQVLARLSPDGRVAGSRQAVDELGRRIERAGHHRLALLRERVGGLERRLVSLDPLAILERGYAVVRRKDGALVRSTSEVAVGDPIDVCVSDGRLLAQVQGVENRLGEEGASDG